MASFVRSIVVSNRLRLRRFFSYFSLFLSLPIYFLEMRRVRGKEYEKKNEEEPAGSGESPGMWAVSGLWAVWAVGSGTFFLDAAYR